MNPLNGLFLVHKPSGITSHDLVSQGRRVFQTKSVGHCGTLDPLAEGLMVLLVGEATKLNQYIVEGNKSYRVGLRFGFQTDTFDITGQVIAEGSAHFSDEQVIAEANRLTGDMILPVPIYSAIKVKGKALYDYARESQEVEIPRKEMSFWGVQFVEKNNQDFIFDIHCSKGSYIRTWVDELGKKLGSFATMTSLVRTGSVPYTLAQAKTLEGIGNVLLEGRLPSCFVSLEKALPDRPLIRLKGQDLVMLKNGQISHGLRVNLIYLFDINKDSEVQIHSGQDGKLVALIGFNQDKGFHIRRVFKY